MGAELPEEPPKIIDDKWYCCTCQDYAQVLGVNSCDNPNVASCNEARTGNRIIEWYESGFECVEPRQLVTCFPLASQRITAIVGPFDSLALCVANTVCTTGHDGPL